jgi:thiamine pyrophosphate-dependent acetolactate synthase large subunit-like protein
METTLDPILSMLAVADRLATTSAPEASRLLAQVQVARDRNERIELVQRTLKVQAEIEQALKQLLERLEEWNDYQDVIQVTRALRDRQRDLQNRTEEAKGK